VVIWKPVGDPAGQAGTPNNPFLGQPPERLVARRPALASGGEHSGAGAREGIAQLPQRNPSDKFRVAHRSDLEHRLLEHHGGFPRLAQRLWPPDLSRLAAGGAAGRGVRIRGLAGVRQVPRRVVEPDGGRGGAKVTLGAETDLDSGGIGGQGSAGPVTTVEPHVPHVAEE
jgi:hypothetical protein